MRVLIVDDDGSIRSGLSRQIKGDGFEVMTCANAQEAIATLSTPSPPPIVILDWILPDLAGPEICRIIRSRTPGAMPYVIMLTIKTDPQDLAEGLDAGADDYVKKPFSMMELRARIRVAKRVVLLRRELREQVARAEAALDEVRQLRELLPICSYCRKIRDEDGNWQTFEDYVMKHTNTRFTHGVCPECGSRADLHGDTISATRDVGTCDS